MLAGCSSNSISGIGSGIGMLDAADNGLLAVTELPSDRDCDFSSKNAFYRASTFLQPLRRTCVSKNVFKI